MDFGHRSLALMLGATLLVLGCGGTSSAPQSSGGSTEVVDTRSPKEVTAEFLEAVRTGDDKQAEALLTPAARDKTAAQDMVVAPAGSDTAEFAVRECIVEEDGAEVACDWSDVDDDGHMHTYRVVWLLRKEAMGWRIAGMASKVFDDRPPVVLNYEDPEDMMKQQQWISEEMARREGIGTPPSNGQPATEIR